MTQLVGFYYPSRSPPIRAHLSLWTWGFPVPLGRVSLGIYKRPIERKPYLPLPSPWCLSLHISLTRYSIDTGRTCSSFPEQRGTPAFSLRINTLGEVPARISLALALPHRPPWNKCLVLTQPTMWGMRLLVCVHMKRCLSRQQGKFFFTPENKVLSNLRLSNF